MVVDLSLGLLVLASFTLVVWIADELLLAPKRRTAVAEYVGKVGEAADEDVVKKLSQGSPAVHYFKYLLGAVWAYWLFQSIQQGDIDFGLVLVVMIALTGFMAILDKGWFERRRKRDKSAYQTSAPHANEQAATALLAEPLSTEYSKSFLPVLAVVLVLRSFLVEPFTIPSGSMIPTLLVGDYILVNKFAYGIRLPVIGTKIMDIGEPQRGDVMVFKYPENPRVNYIKRVIGLPGDKIVYRNKTLTINGEEVKNQFIAKVPPINPEFALLDEQLGDVEHEIQVSYFSDLNPGEWTVPENSYFMMGDNRDNSRDSRAWGFVPDKYVVGKAFYVWMHKPGLTVPSFSRNKIIE